jgi:hypothetical protein
VKLALSSPDDFLLPLQFGLGQQSTHKAFIALVQIYKSTIHKVYPPILGLQHGQQCKVINFASML